MTSKSLLNIRFVLVEPAVPENVGAAARAMKTMGFSEMILVNPCDYLGTKARMLAHGSNEILENAKVFGSLAEALTGFDFIIGTTARRRTRQTDYHQAEVLPELITAKGSSIHAVAVVFGREETGLTNEEIALCDLLSSVSMAATFPSLNLGQAVMLYAYTLSPLAGKKGPHQPAKKNQPGWNALKTKTESFLSRIGVTSDDTFHTRLMERLSLLGDTDVNLLHSLLARIEKNGFRRDP
jgi:tRNA/rRNA methyltransferase